MAHLTDTLFDYIVVGSGLSGAMSAQTLVESGSTVLMLDVGVVDTVYERLIPDMNFDDIRQTENGQHQFFLGKKLECAVWDTIKSGSQLTPSRKYVVENTEEGLPFISDNFFPIESLALGGLGSAWGLGCCSFSEKEIMQAGLDHSKMEQAYQVIADRIGISYSADDVLPYTMEGIRGLQPAIAIDDNHSKILEQYERKKNGLNRDGFFLGKPALALLTKNKGIRQATTYNNMDFYSNSHQSAYRPAITIDYLKTKHNYAYHSGILVTAFREEDDAVRVIALVASTKEQAEFRAKKLVLACNVLATARIVLRSFNQYEKKISLLSNPYNYLTCLHWKMLGKKTSPARTSTVQLSLFHDPSKQNENVAMASLYSYHSLLLHRLAKEIPLNFRDARLLMQYLAPALVIAGVHHPDTFNDNKYIQLKKDSNSVTGDILHAHYELDNATIAYNNKRDKNFGAALRKLGCQPIKKVSPGFGASAHYAGTLPFCSEEKPLTIQKNGRLSGTKNVFIADASGFCYLPAKGISFSLMANAHLTALNALKK